MTSDNVNHTTTPSPVKLTPKQREFLQIVQHWQFTDMSVTWWQLDTSQQRIAKKLSHSGLIREHTNQYHRRGLALTDAGTAALAVSR